MANDIRRNPTIQAKNSILFGIITAGKECAGDLDYNSKKYAANACEYVMSRVPMQFALQRYDEN